MNIKIFIAERDRPLLLHAAQELQRYIGLLYHWSVAIVRELPVDGVVISLGTVGQFGDDKAFCAQTYAIRRRRHGDVDVCEISGGSELAVLWGAYELAESWGVFFLVSGDILPETPVPFHLPATNVHRSPIFETRAFRVLNSMLNSGETWSLSDHEKLFDQLVKLRFNTIHIAANYPFQPWVHWSFRGVQRSAVSLCYGYQHLIHERSIGKEVIGKLGRFTNPDFRDCHRYEEWISRGKWFMHSLIQAAHRRGFRCILGHNLTDLPEEIKRHLPHWSDKQQLPTVPRHRPSPVHLGMEHDSVNFRYGHLMTPRNPVYVEMVESWLAGHLEEYKEIDGIFLTQTEFPPYAANVEECWKSLDDRHGIASKFDLNRILDEASRLEFHQAGRALREAQGAVATIRLLDIVLNEHLVAKRVVGHPIKVYAQFMSELLMPIVSHIFNPDNFEFVAMIDYLPSRVAERIDSLSFVQDSPVAIHLTTTIEDDNVGFFPQLNAPALHVAVKKAQSYGVKGIWFRQFLVSKHEPAMCYLARAAWHRDETPESSNRRLLHAVCGSEASASFLEAFDLIESQIDHTDALIGCGFLMPNLFRLQWEHDKCSSQLWQPLIDVYDQACHLLHAARSASAPRGQPFAESWISYVRFAVLFLKARMLVEEAKRSYRAAEELGKNWESGFDFDLHCESLASASNNLSAAVETLSQAMLAWARGVRDPSDVGTLVGLNVYGLDYLRGMADIIRLKAEYWGLIPMQQERAEDLK